MSLDNPPSSKHPVVFKVQSIFVGDDVPSKKVHTTSLKEISNLATYGSDDEESPRNCSVVVRGVMTTGDSIVIVISGFRPFMLYDEGKVNVDFFSDIDNYTGAVRLGGIRSHTVTRRILRGYDPDTRDPTKRRKRSYVKVSFPNLKSFQKAKNAHKYLKSGGRSFPIPHESMILPSTQFSETTGLFPNRWAEIIDGIDNLDYRVSNARLEIFCDIKGVVPVSDTFDPPPVPDIVLAYDIECTTPNTFGTGENKQRSFPQASNKEDKIIMISSTIWNPLTPPEMSKTFIQCLGPGEVDDSFCKQPGATKVVSVYPTEKDLLEAWAQLVYNVSPAIISGYNIVSFDNGYIAKRAEMCGADIWHMGIIPHMRGSMRTKVLNSSAKGENTLQLLNFTGLTTLDMYSYAKDNLKLTSYTLDNVAKSVLGTSADTEENKIKMDYTEMMDLYEGGASERGKVAHYCSLDSLLIVKLMAKLQAISISTEMSFVTRTTLDDILTRGQQIKVTNLLHYFCHEYGFIMNSISTQEWKREGGGYTGATVLEPKRGFYTTPVACLDFASLYPSIMIGNNISYDTIINDTKHLETLNKAGVGTRKIGNCWFVQSSPSNTELTGVLPRALNALLDARRRVRKAAKSVSSPSLAAIMNGQQLAYKVSANSIYGYTGCGSTGTYPDGRLASSVTLTGRKMIDDTVKFVEEKGFSTIYGDTDSVFLDCKHLQKQGETDVAFVERITPIMNKLSEEASALFPPPNELEFEKVYSVFNIDNKKR